VRVREHIALSTAAAALFRSSLRQGALGFWAGSVLIDADHYAWFCLRQRRLSPYAAVRFFNGAQAPQNGATRTLHSPPALLSVLLIGLRRRGLLPLALGMGLHVALDAYHDARMDAARAQALRRDAFTCQGCGSRAANVDTHIKQQPWLLPSYRIENLVSLCGPCHEAAHAQGIARWN
jgi:hypothetical protein